MRVARLVAVLAIGLMLVTTGCGRTVRGAAAPDPHTPGTAITADGFGIIAGKPDAGIQIELYTEPQCVHCANLQGRFGPQLRSLINLGELAITYRPVTVMDRAPGRYSARVSNALFLAATHGTSGPAFQSFVEDVWGHQQPHGPGPTDAELSAMAERTHIDADAVVRIGAGQSALDTDAMSKANTARLQGILHDTPTTPAVYNLNSHRLLNTNQDNWVRRLMASKMTT
jgi:protein-disulfide isomerase